MNERLEKLMELTESAKAPLIEIIGNYRVLIENHRGITEYTTERIVVKKRGGYVTVMGASLLLAVISNDRIIITGKISDIKLEESGASF